jgi:signal peptidase I
MSKVDTAPVSAGKAGTKGEVRETITTVVMALLVALVVRTLLFQPYTIPSASEEPNLYQGDYIIVSKWDYGYSRHSILFSPSLFSGRIFDHAPRRGDVVVFKLPADVNKDFVKRLVGMPGDRLQERGGRLFINGKPLAEGPPQPVTLTDRFDAEPGRLVRETNPEGRSYLTQRRGDGTNFADETGVYVVPPHCYFMMGDNRQNSLDSRFSPRLSAGDPRLVGCGVSPSFLEDLSPDPGVGFVPEVDLEGRARFVLLSWNKGADFWKPWTWLDLRWNRFLRPIH